MIRVITRELAMNMAHGYCMCGKDCVQGANELHHLLANTETNRRLFPMFIDSIFNLCPINHDCHMSKAVPRISIQQATMFEKWLRVQFTKEN